MTKSELIAKVERKLRRRLVQVSPRLTALMYSSARQYFIELLAGENPNIDWRPPQKFEKTLWGLKFPVPLFNAAGMFKRGEGYYLTAAQKAGAYLAGTTTSVPRRGNEKDGVKHPFTAYPFSASASNWMGLPNDGHAILAKRLWSIDKKDNCPLGVSLAASPDMPQECALEGLVEGLELYRKAGVDFIELNESCPNVSHSADSDSRVESIVKRLEYISEKFLKRRKRNLPAIVKFSNDTPPDAVAAIIEALTELEFDGVNFGNTSAEYVKHESEIDARDSANFRYFTETFGGGLSGKILKSDSLSLCAEAIKSLEKTKPKREFRVIRTGGVETREDIDESEKIGVDLNQWFTGYFESFANHGHNLYKSMFS